MILSSIYFPVNNFEAGDDTNAHSTKNEVPVNDFFSKFHQIHSFWRICSYLLEKSLMENFIFCTVATSKLSCISKFLYSFQTNTFHRNTNRKTISLTF